MCDVTKRAVGLLVLEVINSNPNGDPDRESDPRQRIDERGEISPVSFKRKLRDLVEDKKGLVWKELSTKLGIQEKAEEFDILEMRGRNRDEIKKLDEKSFQEKYWDARIFGSTFLESIKDDGNSDEKNKENKKTDKKRDKSHFIKTGAVQFGLGLSVAPIAIERHTHTNKSGVQEGKDRGMAPLAYRIVQHGVYCMPFFVNPSSAKKSGCTQKDIELMLKLIPFAYKHTASLIRSQVEIRHAFYAEHKSALGSFQDQIFLQSLTPRKKINPDEPSISSDDYDFSTKLPEDLEGKGMVLRDLVKEVYDNVGA